MCANNYASRHTFQRRAITAIINIMPVGCAIKVYQNKIRKRIFMANSDGNGVEDTRSFTVRNFIVFTVHLI